MGTKKDKPEKLVLVDPQDTKTRTTNVNFIVTTYGTEAQRNLTIKRMHEELLLKGFNVNLVSIKTIPKKA